MTYRWRVEDLAERVAFARTHSPTDLFTLIARYVVSQTTSLLALVLLPISMLTRLIGRLLTIFVITLILFLALDIVWLVIWGLLMGSSRLWLASSWLRPILILPGMFIAILAHLYIILAVDPQKDPNYWTVVREWPLTWHLYKPPTAYFTEQQA